MVKNGDSPPMNNGDVGHVCFFQVIHQLKPTKQICLVVEPTDLKNMLVKLDPQVVEKQMANRPYILVYVSPVLTCPLVSVPSILTLRYMGITPKKLYTKHVFFPNNGKLLVWGPVVWGFLASPYERDCYLGAPLESQTTGPQS